MIKMYNNVQQVAKQGEKPIEQLLIANTRESRRNAEEKIDEEATKPQSNHVQKLEDSKRNIAPRRNS